MAKKEKNVVETVDEVVKEEPKKKAVAGSGKSVKSIEQLADEVMKGKHGSGRERMISLGSDYTAVQKEVHRRRINK